jgi:hypothetical protein
MLRRIRRLLGLLLILAVVVAAVVVVLGNRSALDHSRSRVDTRWSALRGPLDARYRQLAALNVVLAQDLSKGAALPTQLTAALRNWTDAAKARDTEAGVQAANQLESLAGLARATATSTDRLKSEARLQQAVAAFNRTTPPSATVDAYNAAVRTYEHDRTTGLRRLTAALFGYHARRTFEAVPTS